MKKIILPTVLAIGVAVLAYGARQIYLLYNSAHRVGKMKVNDASISNINADMVIEISNDSDISAHILNQEYIVYFAGRELSRITSNTPIFFGSNSKTFIPLKINVSPVTAILTTILGFTKSQQQQVLEIKGRLSIKAGVILLRNYEINIVYTLDELIALSLQK